MPKTLWICFIAAIVGTGAVAAKDGIGSDRTVEFRNQVTLPDLFPGAVQTELWLPLPKEDGAQEVSDLVVSAPGEHDTPVEAKYGNTLLRVRGKAEELSGKVVTVSFRVTRHPSEGSPATESADELRKYLEPDRLVPIDGIIAERAEQTASKLTDPTDKARALYDDVVAKLSYDKSGVGWGKGDAIYACTKEQGNCTDFHSLFIGMCRAEKIPARFTIGYPLPPDHGEGTIAGYHCWAEFLVNGEWKPVDASEANKHPESREFLFGHLDPNRIDFTVGRDLILPGHEGEEPLNYFIYPVLYVDGVPVEGTTQSVTYRDLDMPPAGQPDPIGR